jgi:branched-chain amino acid transport system substrate-binding protein
VSTDGRPSRARSRWRLGSRRRAETIRLAVAVALAAGAVVLAESLTGGGGHHRSDTATALAGGAAGGPAGALPSHTSGGPAPGGSQAAAQRGGGATPAVAVAGGAAVTRSLQHGVLNLVIDEPSSSVLAEQNSLITQGAQVAVAELNAAGGLTSRHIRVNLLPESLDGLSPTAVRSRLRAKAAAALILPCDTDTQLALAEGAAQWGLLMFAPCDLDPTAGQRYPTYWPVGTPSSDEASGLTKFMSLYGYLSAYVISTPGSRYFELLAGYFRSAARKRGIQITGTSSVATTTEKFDSVARAIRAAPTSAAIFTAAPPAFATKLSAALRAEGIVQPVAGSALMDTRVVLAGGPEVLENAFFPSNGFARDDLAARRFASDYQRRLHKPPAGSFPALGLETIRLLANAVRKAGSAQPSAIQRTLAGGFALRGVGLADRIYEKGGNHNPVGQVDISKVSYHGLSPLVAINLP